MAEIPERPPEEHPLVGRHPKAVAILICDQVISDATTGKISLIGIFENIAGSSLPVGPVNLCIYAKMTEIQGDYIFKLEIVRRDGLQVIAETALPQLHWDDPMAHADLVMQLAGLVFERAGYYDFQIRANGHFVESKSVQVQLSEGGASS
jgi:hypothetical protein